MLHSGSRAVREESRAAIVTEPDTEIEQPGESFLSELVILKTGPV